MRLDKYIANNTAIPRKQASAAIKNKRVCVDNNLVVSPSTHINDASTITLDGHPVTTPEPLYLMLNKPQNYVCANSDSEHATVFDLIDFDAIHPALKGNLQIAGRLDIDTTGLILITSNGDWNHKVTSPNKRIGKRYHVTLAHPITDQAIAAFEDGIELHNEKTACKPAKLVITSPDTCLLEITEGKYHQVKRMFAAINNKVIKLHREAIADIELDTQLKQGQYRLLTANEILSIG